MDLLFLLKRDALMTENTALTSRRVFVLDTNILIHDPQAIFSFQEHDVVVPMTVLEELDRIKDSPKHRDIQREARFAIQLIDGILNGASAEEYQSGVSIDEGLGSLSVVNDYDSEVISAGKLKEGVPDNNIISAALYVQKQKPDMETVLVTKDLNARLKAKCAGVKFVEDYKSDKLIDDADMMTAGYIEVKDDFLNSGFDNVVSEFNRAKKGTEITLNISELDESIVEQIFLNCYLFNSTDTFRVLSINDERVTFMHKPVSQLMNLEAYGIRPRSVKQAMAMESLLDPEISLVIISGKAGSGKTLLALAAGLSQSHVGEVPRYDKIIVSRVAVEMSEPIGFLPGDESQKMAPWLAAFSDTLEILCKMDTTGHSDDKFSDEEATSSTIGYVTQKANIQYKSVSFMRGRSLQSSYLILDEMQNATAHQLKTLITRIGENSKCVVLGNVAQIDARYLTPQNCAITYGTERFKKFDGSTSIILEGSVRSKLAAFAEENL